MTVFPYMDPMPKIAQALVGLLVPTNRAEITGVLDVRTKTLVILKTSILNGCDYCVGHNSALGRSIGFEDDEIDAIAGDFENSEYFSDPEKAAIAWAECLTERTYRQNPGVMARLKEHYDEAQIVEITMVSGFFNFWNRFTDGLQIDLESSDSVGKIKKSKTIDPDDYVEFMRNCWWRENNRTGAEAAIKELAGGSTAGAD
ncbi:MAG: carboxymuconolactone decarboxylase family protein [Alphaproteobacteria bacterium]|nr:carboxymuconolactone decarboxylase family protein [Alphaproteobacteria bacterium]